MKKILSFFVSIMLIIGSFSPIFALETNESLDKNSSSDSEVLGEFYLSSENENNSRGLLFETGVVNGHLARSGSTTSVDLILSWNGDFQVKGFRFTKLQVTGTSLLNPTIYSTLYTGNYMTYLSSSYSNHLYVSIKRISIPTNVTKAKINVSALQVLTTDGWLSGYLSDATVTIK
ncbi:MAG: hypothetical protein U0L85_06885 [Bacilli bacterium]|nr:hypothetical protein [Bacilli bacterium]